METLELHRLITQECAEHGPFLRQLIPDPKKLALEKQAWPDNRTEVILKIQNLAKFHYNALWKSCSRQEQYLLYDLAQDGLINPKDIQSVANLIDKGLLIYDGTVRIMNRSFRNFILTSIEQEEVLNLERATMDQGAWSEFRTPLILVLVALVSFLFLTQKEAFNQIIAIITTLTASVPLIFRLFSLFSGAGDKAGAKE
jgi:hypothetical protein